MQLNSSKTFSLVSKIKIHYLCEGGLEKSVTDKHEAS